MESRTGCPPRGTSSSLIEAESTPIVRSEAISVSPVNARMLWRKSAVTTTRTATSTTTGRPAAFLNRRARNDTAAAIPAAQPSRGSRIWAGPGHEDRQQAEDDGHRKPQAGKDPLPRFRALGIFPVPGATGSGAESGADEDPADDHRGKRAVSERGDVDKRCHGCLPVPVVSDRCTCSRQ